MLVWQIFPGNLDNLYQTRNTFRPSFAARYVRVVPLQWHLRIGVSVDLLGCSYVRDPPGECVRSERAGLSVTDACLGYVNVLASGEQ